MFLFLLPLQTTHKFVLVLGLLVCLLTLISLLGNYLYFELATHFRWHYALTATFCIVALIAFRSWKAVPFALACALFNWSFVLPYAIAARRTLAGRGDLRVMLANVCEANHDYAALINSVKSAGPDVLVLQEVTEAWGSQLQALDPDYPYIKAIPRPRGSGMALLSRKPLNDTEVLTLDSSTHVAVITRIQIESSSVTLLSLHPTTPISPFKFSNRNRQFREAGTLIRNIKGPRILIGDLNTTMWSPHFRRLVEESGLQDTREGFGLTATWPNPLPRLLQIPIDHCLVSDEVEVVNIRTGEHTGSDHRPLIVDLRIENAD
jgi:endonuclease/exonuclease/phosphatase (EEP) superfamily protein YafD